MWHRLYTHAGAIGGRFVDAENDARRVLPAEAAKHLDDLLKKTRGGFVVRRYGPFVCAIVSELATDAGGRRGVRNDARVIESDDPFAVAQLLNIDAPHAIEDVPREALRDLIAVWLATHGGKSRVRVSIDDVTPRTAAIGWAALPLGLQHGAAWGVDTDDGCPVDVVFSARGRRVGEVAAPGLVELAQAYVARLLDAPPAFRAILRNPAITSAAQLAGAVRGEEGWR